MDKKIEALEDLSHLAKVKVTYPMAELGSTPEQMNLSHNQNC